MELKSIDLHFHSRVDVAKKVKTQEKLETAQFDSYTQTDNLLVLTPDCGHE